MAVCGAASGLELGELRLCSARAEAEGRAYGGRMVFPDLVGLKTATKAMDKSLGVLAGRVESVPLHWSLAELLTPTQPLASN